MLGPVVGALEASSMAALSTRAIVEMLIDLFVREILGTRRKDVIRLIITEGPRFPKLAEFYYREVIVHLQPVLQALFSRALKRGEIRSDALVRFPQLPDRARPRRYRVDRTVRSGVSPRSMCAK